MHGVVKIVPSKNALSSFVEQEKHKFKILRDKFFIQLQPTNANKQTLRETFSYGRHLICGGSCYHQSCKRKVNFSFFKELNARTPNHSPLDVPICHQHPRRFYEIESGHASDLFAPAKIQSSLA